MGRLKEFADTVELIRFLRKENNDLRAEIDRKEQIIKQQAATIQELGGYDREKELSQRE